MSEAVLQRVEAFRTVQAIEYRFDLVNRDQDASCLSKAKKLGDRFAELGLASRQICCRCRWDQNQLPQNLLKRVLSGETHHHFVQVLIPETGRWEDVDPTFDVGLRAAGFVAPDWDGLSSTPLAMKPFAFFDPQRSQEICAIKNNYGAEDWRDFADLFGDFYADLNGWIAAQRGASTHYAGARLEGRHNA